MKVILLEDIQSLGKQDAVVEVSDGHARNFLFPQNLAVPATEEALAKIKEREMMRKKESKKAITDAGKLAERLDGYELELQEKVNEAGHLYASVTKKIITKALNKAGFEIEEEMVRLDEPLKEPGEKTVTIELPHNFDAEVKVIVEGV